MGSEENSKWISILKTNYSAQLEQQTQEIAKLKTQLELEQQAQASETSKLQAHLDQLTQEIFKQQAQLKQQQLEIAKLQAQLDEETLQNGKLHSAQLDEATLQKNKLDKLHSRLIELTTENQRHISTINTYEEQFEASTSRIIELEVSKDRLQKEYDSSMALAKQAKLHQSHLEGQLTVITNQLHVLEEKKAADEEVHLQVRAKQGKEIHKLSVENASLVTLYEALGAGIKTVQAAASNVLANHQNDWRPFVGSDQTQTLVRPSTSTSSAISAMAQKRSGNSLMESLADVLGLKRRREANEAETDQENEVVNHVTVEIVVETETLKTEGFEIETDQHVGEGVDFCAEVFDNGEDVDLCTQVFGNDKIMANIVKYLPIGELLQLRLTCKTWNSTVTKVLRETNSVLEFGPDEHNLKVVSKSTNDGSTLANFLETMSGSQDVPFGKFAICNLSFSMPLANLLQICGNVLTHLKITLEEQNVFVLQDLRAVIFQLTPALKDLTLSDIRSPGQWWAQEFTSDEQILELDTSQMQLPTLNKLEIMVKFHSDPCRESFVGFLAEIIKAGVNLEHLDVVEVIGENHVFNPNNSFNLAVLRKIEQAANLTPLKSLKVYDVLDEEVKLLIHLSRLDENALKLTSFSTSLIECPVSTHHAVNEFLELQAGSLQKLDILLDFVENESESAVLLPIQLPKMAVLEQLSIDVDNAQQDNIRFAAPAEAFPNLRSFKFVHGQSMCLETWQKYFPEPHSGCSGSHGGVQVLEATIDKFGCAEKLSQLCKLFPNVRELKLCLGYLDPLRYIWGKWARLEKLYVYFYLGQGSELTSLDELLTGIPYKYHRVMKMRRASSSSGANLVNEIKKNWPSVSDSKSLRELTLDFSESQLREVPSVYIPDISVHYGLALATNLQTLRILPDTLISETCKAALLNVLESDS